MPVLRVGGLSMRRSAARRLAHPRWGPVAPAVRPRRTRATTSPPVFLEQPLMDHQQRKDSTMPTTSDQHQPPTWTRTAHRLDRPKIDVWYKPEEGGALDGFLIWQGQEE